MFNPGGYDDSMVWDFATQFVNAEMVAAVSIVAVVVGLAHIAISALSALGEK